MTLDVPLKTKTPAKSAASVDTSSPLITLADWRILSSVILDYFRKLRRSHRHELIHRVSADSRPYSGDNPIEISDAFVPGGLLLDICKRAIGIGDRFGNFRERLVVSNAPELIAGGLLRHFIHFIVRQIQYESVCQQKMSRGNHCGSLVTVPERVIRDERPKQRGRLCLNIGIRILTKSGREGRSHRRLKQVHASDIMLRDGLVPRPFSSRCIVVDILRVTRPKLTEANSIPGQGDSARNNTEPRRTRMRDPVSFQRREVCAE
jgi:hypothetical protein